MMRNRLQCMQFTFVFYLDQKRCMMCMFFFEHVNLSSTINYVFKVVQQKKLSGFQKLQNQD